MHAGAFHENTFYFVIRGNGEWPVRVFDTVTVCTAIPQKLPQEHDKELKVMSWPQNGLSIHGICLKNYDP